MNKKLLILLIAAIVSVCLPGRMFAYIDGFKQTGYVLYLNSTEHETLELADPTLDGLVTFSSSDENVVKLNGKELIPKGAGEAIIKATCISAGLFINFEVGVKVINSIEPCELFMRVVSGDNIPETGVVVSKYRPKNPSGAPYKYALMIKSGTTTGMRDVYGTGEIVFDPSSAMNNAIHAFDIAQVNDTYKISIDGKYLIPSTSIMKYENYPDRAATEVNIDSENYIKIHYVDNTATHANKYVYFDCSSFSFKYVDKKDINYPVELYTLKTVTFETPDVDGVKLLIDDVENSSDNIQLGDGEHQLKFMGIPDGAKLYYKFNSTGEPQQVVAKEGSNGEWTRYVEGQSVPVNKSSGQIEYYTESHGLQSDHKEKTFTVPTGSNCIGIDSNDMDATIYFDLNGNRVNPTDLKPGIYIKRVGAKAEKVVI